MCIHIIIILYRLLNNEREKEENEEKKNYLYCNSSFRSSFPPLYSSNYC